MTTIKLMTGEKEFEKTYNKVELVGEGAYALDQIMGVREVNQLLEESAIYSAEPGASKQLKREKNGIPFTISLYKESSSEVRPSLWMD